MTKYNCRKPRQYSNYPTCDNCHTEFVSVFYHCPKCYHSTKEGLDGFDVCEGCFLMKTLPERVADHTVAAGLSIPPQRGSYAAALTADCDGPQCTVGGRKRTVECLVDEQPETNVETRATRELPPETKVKPDCVDLTGVDDALAPPLCGSAALEADRSVDISVSHKKRRRDDKPMKVWVQPDMLAGSCSFVGINEILKSGGLKEIIPLEAFHEAIDKAQVQVGAAKNSYFNPENTADMQIHYTVLRRLFSNFITKDGLRIEMKNCWNEHGTWHRKKWITEQKKGLYLLFGYIGEGNNDGHYVGYDANKDIIFDGYTQKCYNMSFESLRTVFPNRYDCAFEFSMLTV